MQGSFDELGTPLREVCFVVVDLETTGGSPATAGITEIGAVRVRGGQVLGEFQTLVNPGAPIPPFIAVLTGITDAMVASAPGLAASLPAFLEFARGSVLVAHNAPLAVGFLRAAATRLGQPWPDVEVVDTARLARHVLTRDDAPDCKLATLARIFRAGTTPTHRALADARATVDVLHGLIERLAGHGVGSLEELATFSSRVTPEQRRKRHLAAALPHAPGVYVFRDRQGRVLYVGKSKDIRSRVRTYFTASERRSRMAEMVAVAETVTPVVCPTALEAEVRELRLLAEHKPRYNRRSRFPERALWLKLTVEAFPRLSLVRTVHDDEGRGATYLGPFGSARSAELARVAVTEAFRLRQCTARLSPRRHTPACALAEMGRCGAPCEGHESVAEYAVHVAAARAAFSSDIRRLRAKLSGRISRLAGAERYEDAAATRDRLAAFVRAAARTQRLRALTACALLAATRPTAAGTWEVVAVRHGRLVGSIEVPSSSDVRPALAALLATAEPVTAGPGPVPAASAEETECILRWLDDPGTRLLELDGVWSSPAHGAGGSRGWVEAATRGGAAAEPLADRRGLRPPTAPAVGLPPTSRPAR